MSIDVPKFQMKTETEIKNYDVIKSVLSKLYETENDLIKKRKEAFDDISKINEENIDLKNIYVKFAEDMKGLEESKNNQVMKIKTKLIPTTEAYITEAKKTKQEIGNYKNISSKTKSQEEEIKKLEMKGDEIKKSQISLNVSHNKKAMANLGKNLEDQIMKYEFDRLTNNNLIMLHLINYETAYHAKAIENLTNLFKEVKEINPKKSLKQSVTSLHLSKKVEEVIDENSDEDRNENEEDDEEDEDNIKESRLSKSKKASVRKSQNKSQKKDDDDKKSDDNEIDDDE